MIIDATVGRQLMQDLGEGNFLLLDIRHPYEYETGHIPGAVLLDNDDILAGKGEEILPKEKDFPIIIYCRSGVRTKSSAKNLAGRGYTKVYDMGGILDWPFKVTR